MPWTLQKKLECAFEGDHRCVAIKLIYGISSPKRVANEIMCLSELRLHLNKVFISETTNTYS